MRLYTICIDHRPVLVISAGVEPIVPDSLTAEAELMKAYRERRARLDHLPDEVQRITEHREINEALDTWLGTELRSMTYDGSPLWSGDRANLEIREAKTDEAQRWHASLQRAIETGERDALEEDWLIFLVPASEIDEEGWCGPFAPFHLRERGMPRTRTVMRRIREVVRLKSQLGLNGRLERLPIRPDTGRSREGLGGRLVSDDT